MTDGNHAMTVRLSDARYERLRLEAFQRRTSMGAIINEALDEHAAQDPALAATAPGITVRCP